MAIFDDPLVRKLYDDARQYDEWATVKFWIHILTRYGFPESKYVVSPEQPPVRTGSQRRMDITVETFEGSTLLLHMVVEAKKASAAPRAIIEVETQLYSGCYEHYTGNPTRQRIWTMSVTGPCARIWAFDAESGFLTAALPVDNDHGERASYMDFQIWEKELMEYIAFVKDNLVPPDSIFDGSDTSMSEIEILDEGSVVLARATKIRDKALEIELLVDGSKVRTIKERWDVARGTVDGEVVDGHKYTGNSGQVYFAINVADFP